MLVHITLLSKLHIGELLIILTHLIFYEYPTTSFTELCLAFCTSEVHTSTSLAFKIKMAFWTDYNKMELNTKTKSKYNSLLGEKVLTSLPLDC